MVDIKIENDKKMADSDKYKITAKHEPYKEMDWKKITAISANNTVQNDIAIAFRELAENAQNIQNLNITPDLLQTIMQNK